MTIHKLARYAVILVACLGAGLADHARIYAQTENPKAIRVFGQPDFVSNDPNHGAAVDANGLNFPLGLVIDGKGGIYVADRNNNRVLYFANDGDTKAARVYGQFGNFATNVPNNDGRGNPGAPGAENLNMPTAVALDSKGGLYVLDRDNHRVLHFANNGDTKADRVYGQFGNFTTNVINNDGKGSTGAPSAENLGRFLLGIAIDSKDDLYVSDSSNNRVLYFANDGNTKAVRVYGQFGNFTTNLHNNDGTGKAGLPSADNLTFPRGLAVDSKGGLYVADRDNHRVLHFANNGDTKADRVYGQFGSFTTNAPNNNGFGETQNGAASAENLFSPRGIALDNKDGLYVSDTNNNRILYFANDSDTKADRVYGQFSSFTMNVLNNGGKNTPKLPSAENLAGPQYVAVGPDGKLYISDTVNNRLLVYEKIG